MGFSNLFAAIGKPILQDIKRNYFYIFVNQVDMFVAVWFGSLHWNTFFVWGKGKRLETTLYLVKLYF